MSSSDPNWQTPLLDVLQQSVNRPHAAFYAPGHKLGRGINSNIANLLGRSVFKADLPELPELDSLFAPNGAIAAAQQLAADTFGSSKTWFLVNGSTCGVIASILATCGMGEKIILPRNIHISAIAGLILSGAVPVFIEPEYDRVEGLAYNVTPEALERALQQHPDTKAVMILHPTYQGVCGDLEAIALITHQYHIPLLVDEAHGAHFAFHSELPPSALSAGADLTIQSTHKVLSAFTQASMMHLQGDRIDSQRLSKSLQLVESTSPSYLLLASLDAARQQMATKGTELMTKTLKLAAKARSELETIPRISILKPQRRAGFAFLDSTRLTINISGLGITGFTADEILHQELGVTCELPLLHHLTFIISLGNTQQDIDRLIHAFRTLSLSDLPSSSNSLSPPLPPLPTKSPLTPRQAYFSPSETILIEQASDRLCAELICPYPPGIPILMPGELITSNAIEYLQQVLTSGGTITGCSDSSFKTIQVIS